MRYLPAILSLLTGIAGWFYLFYSKAAHGLAGVEQDVRNRRRIRLRRAGGVVMLLLSLGFYLGFYAADPARHPRSFVGVWLAVFLLLGALVVLALVDVRLTLHLRHRRNRGFDVRRPDARDDGERGRGAVGGDGSRSLEVRESDLHEPHLPDPKETGPSLPDPDLRGPDVDRTPPR